MKEQNERSRIQKQNASIRPLLSTILIIHFVWHPTSIAQLSIHTQTLGFEICRLRMYSKVYLTEYCLVTFTSARPRKYYSANHLSIRAFLSGFSTKASLSARGIAVMSPKELASTFSICSKKLM